MHKIKKISKIKKILEKILVYFNILVFAVFFQVSCMMVNDEQRREQAIRIENLEKQNKELQNKNEELLAQNRRLHELSQKLLDKLKLVQEERAKLVQENMDLYQKLYRERMEEQKALLLEREKRVRDLEQEAQNLLLEIQDTQGQIKRNEEQISQNEALRKIPSKEEKSFTSKQTKEENKLRENKSLVPKQNLEQMKDKLERKRRELVELGAWNIDDQREFYEVTRQLTSTDLSYEEEQAILKRANALYEKMVDRAKKYK